jgi:catechol 2,3-dioxygenase-like lactoylglutathione lyase family enzyme
MILKHVALASHSEEYSDKFYGTLLGLKKLDSKMLAASLSKQIFMVDAETQILNYADNHIHFEIFVNDQNSEHKNRFEHVCLEVEDPASFLKKCHEMGVEILQIPKRDRMLTFIRDDDGNLFEIK